MKCVEFIKELISCMKQKGFVDEFHNIAVYKIQELFLGGKKKADGNL